MDYYLVIYCIFCAVGPFSWRAYTQPSPPTYSTDLETSLRSELFNSSTYSVLQRPEQRVNTFVTLTLLTVNELNIKDQLLSISGYLTVRWFDSRLSWSNTSTTSQDYSNVRFLFSTEAYTWRPALIIENSVTDISVISDTNIPMRISSSGLVSWNPAGIYQVACESDITYYPLDSQTCTIKVSTWGYTQSEINLLLDQWDPVDLSFYGQNGEWELLTATGEKANAKSRGGESFSSLSFHISLRRRPLFHVLNTIFPVVLMAFLIPMVYKLPADSGEKIGYSLTVLLAYAVYLTLISDNIPSTSVSVCLLSVYLDLTLALSTVSVNFVIVVLCAHHEGDQEVPKWIKKLTFKFLNKIACVGESCCCFTKKFDSRSDTVTPVKELEHTTENQDGLFTKKDAYILDDCEGLTFVQFAVILDKFLFVTYMVLITLSSLIFIIIICAHYASY